MRLQQTPPQINYIKLTPEQNDTIIDPIVLFTKKHLTYGVVAIFGFDCGISILHALNFVLIFKTMELNSDVLSATTNNCDWICTACG